MSKRGGNIAFYGLLLCVSTLAITLSLVPLHHRRPAAGGATASTEPQSASGPGDRAFGEASRRQGPAGAAGHLS